MYKTTIGEFQFEYENAIQTSSDFALTQAAGGGYQCVFNGKSVVADVVKIDKESKQVVLRIEGKKYTVQIKEPIDLMLERLGLNVKASRKLHQLKSPMPGLIIKVLVKEGDVVKQGDPLLILEAMKMENVFKASGDAVIKSIKVAERQAVEKGEELIAFA
ncbi:MAG TPA: acetyl-CoA carboxylase biotin carboxyl carrier protein subunit [Chitinophagaceae bacterium]|nr:acetyl-CoA carboxylase biotin carboxyl carrier protein subunit [Chitinophagaceae bacterium]